MQLPFSGASLLNRCLQSLNIAHAARFGSPGPSTAYHGPILPTVVPTIAQPCLPLPILVHDLPIMAMLAHHGPIMPTAVPTIAQPCLPMPIVDHLCPPSLKDDHFCPILPTFAQHLPKVAY